MRRQERGILCLAMGAIGLLMWPVACQEQKPVKPRGVKPTKPAVSTEEMRFEAAQFGNIVGGAAQGSQVNLYSTRARFTIPIQVAKSGDYEVEIFGSYSKPGPCELGISDRDPPGSEAGTLGKVVFPKGLDRPTTQSTVIRLTPSIRQLIIYLVEDYFGPEGDRNAFVSRVVIRPKRAQGAIP